MQASPPPPNFAAPNVPIADLDEKYQTKPPDEKYQSGPPDEKYPPTPKILPVIDETRSLGPVDEKYPLPLPIDEKASLGNASLGSYAEKGSLGPVDEKYPPPLPVDEKGSLGPDAEKGLFFGLDDAKGSVGHLASLIEILGPIDDNVREHRHHRNLSTSSQIVHIDRKTPTGPDDPPFSLTGYNASIASNAYKASITNDCKTPTSNGYNASIGSIGSIASSECKAPTPLWNIGDYVFDSEPSLTHLVPSWDAPTFCVGVFTVLFGLLAWLMTMLSICCTPWRFLLGVFLGHLVVLFVVICFMVPIAVVGAPPAINGLACCLYQRYKRFRADRLLLLHDEQPQTPSLYSACDARNIGAADWVYRVAAVMMLTALAATTSHFITREQLPFTTASALAVNASVEGDTINWSFRGQFFMPWCSTSSDSCFRLKASTTNRHGLQTECDGSFYGNVNGVSDQVMRDGLQLEGLMAVCGGCFSATPVQPFTIIPPGWDHRHRQQVIEFVDNQHPFGYLYGLGAMLFIVAITYCAICLHCRHPISHIPRICKHPSQLCSTTH